MAFGKWDGHLIRAYGSTLLSSSLSLLHCIVLEWIYIESIEEEQKTSSITHEEQEL